DLLDPCRREILDPTGLAALHERQTPLTVPIADRVRFPRLDQPLPAVLAQRLQQPVAGAAAGAIDLDERLLDERAEQVQGRNLVDPPAADLLGGGERETTREHGKSSKEQALRFGQQVVAPVDRGA